MADIVKPEYPCSQKDLYSILETAWINFAGHQTEFAAHKALYTAAYMTAAVAAIAAAKALPDEQARGEISETLHVALAEQGEVCRQNFRKLKSYIVTAYPNPEVQKAKFEAAGQSYYRDAGNDDWESVVMLIQSGINFIDNYTGDLEAGDNMPETFAATYSDDGDGFNEIYAAFKNAEQTSEQTAAKINANNECYRTGINMMKDGQIIFETQPEIAVKFVFQSLWDLVNPAVAGIKGIVKKAIDNLPIAGVIITAQQSGEPVITTETDTAGNYSLRLAAGTYQVTASKTGFASQTVDAVVETGNYRTINFSLVAV